MVLYIMYIITQMIVEIDIFRYASFSVQYMFFGTVRTPFAGAPSLAKLLLRTLPAYS